MTRHDEIQKAMANLAQGYVVQFLLAQHFRSSPDPAKTSASFLAHCESVAEQMAFDHLDPAESDLAAQEFRDSLLRLALRAQAIATGQPFDPTAFERSYRSNP